MDLRVVVLSADDDLAELIRAQVENLGCRCTVATAYDEGSGSLAWADAAVVDLAGEGLEDLYRLRVEAPTVRVLAVAPDERADAAARTAGAVSVLVEPFAIADIIEAIRALKPTQDATVVDLRTGERAAAPEVEDAPWFSTR